MIILMISLEPTNIRRVLLAAGAAILMACGGGTPNYTLSTVKSVSLEQGKTAKPGIRVLTEGGFTDEVFFAYVPTTPLPAGLSLQFSPASSKVFTALVIDASETTPAGDYPITIRSIAGSLERTTQMTIKVLDKPFSFTLGDTAKVEQGNTVDVPLTIARRAGYAGAVNFVIDTATDVAIPDALKTAQYIPSATDPDKGNLRFTVPTSVKAGDYSVKVTAQGSSYEVSRTVSLSVVNPPNPDFTVSSSTSSFSITAVGNQTATVTVGRLRGFSGSVDLALVDKDAIGHVIPLPTGLQADFSPIDAASGTSTLTLKAGTGIINKTYNFYIQGTSGTVVREQTITANVNIAPNFLVSVVSPSINVRQGEKSAPVDVTVGAIAGFSGAVAFTATNQDGSALPAGLTVSFLPTQVTLGTSATTQMTVAVTRDVPVQNFNLRVEARPIGNPSDTPRTVNFSVNVLPEIVSGLTLLLPEEWTEILGNEFSFPVSIIRVGNLSSDVALSMPSPPSTFINVHFQPQVLNVSTSLSQVYFTPDVSTVPGSYTAPISATAGSIKSSGGVKINVVDFKLGAPATSATVIPGNSANYTVGRVDGFGFVVRLRLLKKDGSGNYQEVLPGDPDIDSYYFGLQGVANQQYLPSTDKGLLTTLTVKTKTGLPAKILDLRVAGDSSVDMLADGTLPLKPIQTRYLALTLNVQP